MATVTNNITLLDIVKKNGSDAMVGLVDQTIRATPEVNFGAARTIKGLNYKTLIRTSLPTVAFRDANSGATVGKSTYENRLIETYLLNPRIQVDKAVADVDEDGVESCMALEGSSIFNASLQLLGKQFYYGRPTSNGVAVGVNRNLGSLGGDAKGFPGLLDYVDSSLVLSAGGTTANTGSSVWFVAFGQQLVQWVWGADGQLAVTPQRVQDLYDANNNPFTGYVSEILAHPGLQVQNKYSLIRISNLTADSGKGLTDALLGQALALLPASFRAIMQSSGRIFAAPRSIEQLRASRTTFSPTGQPAPTPESFEGIPLVATDSISVTESLSLA